MSLSELLQRSSTRGRSRLNRPTVFSVFPSTFTIHLTDRGAKVLDSKPARINLRLLNQFPEFVEFRHRRHEREEEEGEGTVGRREIQQFAGALQGQKANKGVFITTSTFTPDAKEFVKHLGSKIVLIDGFEPSELMIDRGLGVTETASYQLKRIDSDFFAEEL